MGSFPVTFADKEFTSADFAGHNYVHGFPSMLQSASQALSERVGLTFQVNRTIDPILGPLTLKVPANLPIIDNTILSFTDSTPPGGPFAGGNFLLRVVRYDPSIGQLVGIVVLVNSPRPAGLWTVGMDRVPAVNNVSDGGSGLHRLEQMPLARAQLGLPGPSHAQVREDFHEGKLPRDWTTSGSDSPLISFPSLSQWDGTGTYQSRSFIRLNSGSSYVVSAPAYAYTQQVRLRFGIRRAPGSSGFSIYSQDSYSNGFDIDSETFGAGTRVGLAMGTPVVLSTIASEFEHWDVFLTMSGTCTISRNETTVVTGPAYPEGRGPAWVSFRAHPGGVPGEYLDIDYFYMEVLT